MTVNVSKETQYVKIGNAGTDHVNVSKLVMYVQLVAGATTTPPARQAHTYSRVIGARGP